MTSMKIVQFSRPPPPCPSMSKIFPKLTLDVQFQMKPLPLQMKNNRLKENVIQG